MICTPQRTPTKDIPMPKKVNNKKVIHEDKLLPTTTTRSQQATIIRPSRCAAGKKIKLVDKIAF